MMVINLKFKIADMKNIFKLLPALFLFAASFSSCKKDENKVYFEGGTDPVLSTPTAGALVLLPANQSNAALQLNWTNPDYRFTTGVSSQDVTYILQVDTSGANFTNPDKQEISISKDLSKNFTVKELNAVLTKLNVKENIPHNIEFRIKSTLVNSTVPLYSNVIQKTITPYLDVAIPIPTTGQLFITGNACPSDWTNNPPLSQKCTQVSNTEYFIIMAFVSGKEYKFLTNPGNWQPQYGVKSGTDAAGDIGLNNNTPQYPSDPDTFKTPATAGNYKITLNFKTGKYTVVKQ